MELEIEDILFRPPGSAFLQQAAARRVARREAD